MGGFRSPECDREVSQSLEGSQLAGTHLETLREVHHLEPSRIIEFSKVDDELVSAAIVLVDKLDAVVVSEAGHGVVGTQHGDLRRVCEPLSSKHLNVSPVNIESEPDIGSRN